MIKIPEAIIKRIIQHANDENPLEACGYLAGTGTRVTEIYPMTNEDHSPDHYSFNPEEQFATMEKAQKKELDLIAVYHTHPGTLASMSAEDIRLAYDTSIYYVIYSLTKDHFKAFRVNSIELITSSRSCLSFKESRFILFNNSSLSITHWSDNDINQPY